MRLYAVDELPYHQQPTPFHTVATSDAHFNDGYFFAFYAQDWYFFAGLRLHPNVNVIDGWASVAHDERQRAVRSSRALRPRYDELFTGPISLEVVEPMQCVRLRCADNPSGVSFDVELRSVAPPFAEERYQHLQYGAVINDTIRYTTVCRAHGTATVDGGSIPVEGWHGMRDHSWGIRSSMAVPTGIRGVDRENDDRGPTRALRLWVPFEAGDHSGFVNTHEDPDGDVIDFEGRLDFAGGRSVPLESMSHALEYLPGTRRPIGGTFTLRDADGVERIYVLRASGTPADVQAGGYYRGWTDGGGPGIYRGAEVIETDDYPTAPGGETTGPPHVPVQHRLGPTEHPMHMTGPDGGPGMAHVEHTLRGTYRPYGFEGGTSG